MTYTHFSAEGEVSFKAILFVPKSAERDMFNDYGQKKGDNIKVTNYSFENHSQLLYRERTISSR